MTAPRIDLNDAAAKLDVHYQTAYRWVRSGRLPAVVVGGKYEIDPADVARLIDDRSQPERPKAPGKHRLERHTSRVHDALVDGDEAAARRMVASLASEGTPLADLIETVIVPPLRQIGENWHNGELSIWVEHRASAIVERLLADLTPNPRGRRRGTVMVAAVSGDRHSLPTAMATAVLRGDNWSVHHLGSDMPPDELLEFVRSHDVDAAALSSTTPDTQDLTIATAERLRDAGVPTLIGRPGSTLANISDDLTAAIAELRSARA